MRTNRFERTNIWIQQTRIFLFVRLLSTEFVTMCMRFLEIPWIQPIEQDPIWAFSPSLSSAWKYSQFKMHSRWPKQWWTFGPTSPPRINSAVQPGSLRPPPAGRGSQTFSGSTRTDTPLRWTFPPCSRKGQRKSEPKLTASTRNIELYAEWCNFHQIEGNSCVVSYKPCTYLSACA